MIDVKQTLNDASERMEMARCISMMSCSASVLAVQT